MEIELIHGHVNNKLKKNVNLQIKKIIIETLLVFSILRCLRAVAR